MKRSDDRIPENETVQEKPIKAKKRQYTKRKTPANSKDTAKKGKSDNSESKPAKRPYKKRERKSPKTATKQKLKIKMQMKKVHREFDSTCNDDNDDHDYTFTYQNPADESALSSVSNVNFSAVTSNPDSQCHNKARSSEEKDQDKTETTKGNKDDHVARDVSSSNTKSCEQLQRFDIEPADSVLNLKCDSKQASTTVEGSGTIKLGNVKIVLTKCGSDTRP